MRLPHALPDEVLFSRLCRHLTLSGFNKDKFIKEIFGSSRLSIHPYLNSHLPYIEQAFEEPSMNLWRTQTLLPLFSNFLPKYRNQIQDLNLSSNELVRVCQIASFREREVLNLKFCPICAKEDIKKYGVSYWHRCHQIPGIEACTEHNAWLVHQPLPEGTHLEAGLLPSCDSCAQPSSELAWLLAKYSENILAKLSEGVCKEPDYKSDLLVNGYITQNGRVRRKAIYSDFFKLIEALDYSDTSLLPESKFDYRYISPLLADEPTQHPFKHLLFSYWLKSDFSCSRQSMRLSILAPQLSKLKSIERRCMALLQDGYSMAEVSRRTGKSRCYLKALALRENIPINLKPKIITPRLQKRIIALARKGFHRKTIANIFDISTGSVELYISIQPWLVEWRKQCKYESKRRRYKAHIIHYCRTFPEAIRQDVKQHCNAAFHWLYSHEKQWLELVLPKPTKPTIKARVDWAKRDAELVKKVREVMKKNGFHLSRTELDRLLGGHGWLTRKKRKLPNAIKTYHSLFCHQPDF